MDKKINIPYLIVSHMLQAGKDKVMSLPYSHLLIPLLDRRHNPLPPHVNSENLLRYLPKFRWVSQDRDNGTIFWKPDDSAVNSWIKAPGVEINQYRDPENPNNYAYPSKTGKKGETSSSVPQEPQESQSNPNDLLVQMQTMFTTWSTGFEDHFKQEIGGIRGDITNLNTRMEEVSTQVTQIREFQNTLQANWFAVHGNWNTPQPFDANAFDANAFFSAEGGEGNEEQGGDGNNDMEE